MKHTRTIVFHLSLFKVKILCLIVGKTHGESYAVIVLVGTSTASAGWPKNQHLHLETRIFDVTRAMPIVLVIKYFYMDIIHLARV